MEQISALNPMLQAAWLGFSLLTGGPPMLVAQGLALGIANATPPVAAEIPAPLAPAAPPPAIALATPITPPALALPAPGKKLEGLAAWNVLVGNTIAGKSDDDDLFEFYAKNGTAHQMVGGEKAKGKWAVKGQNICFDYDNGDGETCYTIVVTGKKATFTDEDDNESVYEILTGNPKKL